MPRSDPVAGRIGRKELPRAPTGLSASARRLWRSAVEAFQFADPELAVLESACRCWTRAEEARAVLADEGLTTTAGSGMRHAHPLLRVERDCMKEFRLSWRALGLVDVDGLE